MVRTRADNCARKAVAAKAPRKVLGSSSSGGGCGGMSSPKAAKYAGANAACDRPTPDWQKGIGCFMKSIPSNKENEEPTEDAVRLSAEDEGAASSSSKSCEKEVAETCTEETNKNTEESEDMQTEEAAEESEEQSAPIQKNGLIDDSDED